MDPAVNSEDRDWKGYAALKHLFVFGDSYSSIRLLSYHPKEPKPTKEQPLGVPYPGFTFAGNEKANWVGILVKEYTHSPIIVYNYAEGGNTTKELVRQVRKDFMPHAGTQKNEHVPWTPSDSLFVTWIGINDIGKLHDPEVAQKLLFELQHDLYETGARNFLIFNVPPLPRSRIQLAMLKALDGRRDLWNNVLFNNIHTFTASHPCSSVFLFDAHGLFEEIMDHPEDFGFSKDAGRANDQKVWVDHIHPTEQVHDIIAQRVAGFLNHDPKPIRQAHLDHLET